jgi:hypothetical protein
VRTDAEFVRREVAFVRSERRWLAGYRAEESAQTVSGREYALCCAVLCCAVLCCAVLGRKFEDCKHIPYLKC